jgi:hypothetical protein
VTGALDVVYLAVSGEYSDFRVNRVFTDPSDVDRYVATLGGRVEEYQLNHGLPAATRMLHKLLASVIVDWKPFPSTRLPGVVIHDWTDCYPAFPGVDGPEGDRPVVAIDREDSSPSPYRALVGRVTVTGYVERTVRQAYSEALAGLVAEGEATLAAGMGSGHDNG